MNTIILLIIPLLVLAPTLAYATADSSYTLGYKTSYDWYKCYTEEHQNEACDTPNHNIHETCSEMSSIDNQTACVDGMVNGWIDYCKTYMNDCLRNTLYGDFPDVHGILKQR
jgi:hypothetical protein